MTVPPIVTPSEAQRAIDETVTYKVHVTWRELAHTVATEPDRTRAAVVAELRKLGERSGMPHEVQAFATGVDRMEIARWLDERADAIENGAPL